MSREAAPRLGRGLAALLGEDTGAETGDTLIRRIPVEALEPGPFQPRRDAGEALQPLVDSIRAQGVLQPLLARPHPDGRRRYQIIAGERRWRAAQLAGLSELPVLIRALDDAAALAAGLVENLQRADLNAIEEAEGYRRLIDEFAMTQEALSASVGKSRSHIANTLRLLNLPHRVQAEVRIGALSAGHARALLAHPDPERAAQAVIRRGLNVRQTEALARDPGTEATQTEADRRTPTPRDPDIAALERSLTDQLGLRVQILSRPGGGSVRLHYTSLDQLEGIITLLTRD